MWRPGIWVYYICKDNVRFPSEDGAELSWIHIDSHQQAEITEPPISLVQWTDFCVLATDHWHTQLHILAATCFFFYLDSNWLVIHTVIGVWAILLNWIWKEGCVCVCERRFGWTWTWRDRQLHPSAPLQSALHEFKYRCRVWGWSMCREGRSDVLCQCFPRYLEALRTTWRTSLTRSIPRNWKRLNSQSSRNTRYIT